MAPVICLGAFGPVAPPLARRFGTEAVLLASLLALAIGCVVRSFGAAPLFVGTVIIGASMCLLGVLTPVIVKRDFPRHVGLMMGLYTMLICLGPAVATAAAVPMQHALGDSWERVLLFWGLPALIGAIVFLPQLFRQETKHRRNARHQRFARSPGLASHRLFRSYQLARLRRVQLGTEHVASPRPRSRDERHRGLDQLCRSDGHRPAGASYCRSATRSAADHCRRRGAHRRRSPRLYLCAGVVAQPVSVLLGLGQGGAFGVGLLLFVLRAGDPHAAANCPRWRRASVTCLAA